MKRCCYAACLLLIAELVGCQSHPPLPEYQWVDQHQALNDLAEQADRIQTIMSRCDVRVDSDWRHSTVVQGAMVAKCPDHLRLRLWKWTHAILDLTVTPEGVWLMLADEKDAQASGLANREGIDQVSRFNQFLSSAFFRDKKLEVVYDLDELYMVRKTPGHGAIHCTVDRRTLTVKEYRFENADGKLGAKLVLSDYRLVTDEIAWPYRWRWTFDKVKLDVKFVELDINVELPERVFVPSRRAQKRS